MTVSIEKNEPAIEIGKITAPSTASDHTNDSLKFLIGCWKSPELCHQLVTRDPRTNVFKHLPASSPEHALTLAIREASVGRDVYFAVAEYRTRENRKAENAAGAFCLWMDIDVGEKKAEAGDGYGTIEEALTAVICFCAAAGIPEPTHIVHSGAGLHLYWMFDLHIGCQLWLMLASKLKAIAKHLNFLADPSRTADIASILRVPGTLNYKYSPPRPVELICATDTPITLCVMADAVTAAYGRLIGAEPKRPCKSHDSIECVDVTLLEAILQCLDPDMIQPDWFKVAAGMFNHSRGSESAYELFDSWSSQGNKYKGQTETLKLWRSLKPDHQSLITLGTLRLMIREAGFDWEQDVLAVAQKLERAV